MAQKHPPLIALLGPTASGKTSLALQLARAHGGYIISADSRQVYRGMDIGTAKPTKAERRRVRHFLVDVVDPDEPFTLADYQRQVGEVLARQPGLPFLVGGTGLYLDAVLHNWQIPRGAIQSVRAKLQGRPLASLVEELQRTDPDSAATIDLKNERRVIRALEVALTTGKSFVAQRHQTAFPYRVLKLGIAFPRAELIRRIDARVDAMVQRGLVTEVRRLAKRYGWELPAMSGIGYRQIGAYLRGEVSEAEAIERTKIASRRYAKRQMTWFKRDKEIHWVRTVEEAEALVEEFLRT